MTGEKAPEELQPLSDAEKDLYEQLTGQRDPSRADFDERSKYKEACGTDYPDESTPEGLALLQAWRNTWLRKAGHEGWPTEGPVDQPSAPLENPYDGDDEPVV